MVLQWDDKARVDFIGIIDYIAERNEPAAVKVEEAVARTLEFLSINPFMYRSGRVTGTREAVVTPNYVVIYRIEDDRIRIVRVLHTRQSYP